MAFDGRVFAERHNWADQVIERLSWLTNVITHRDGSEQRRQVRRYPRRMLEYSILPETRIHQSKLEHFLWAASDEAMIVPIWTDAQRLGTAATSGTNTVTVDTTTYDYDADAYVMLWASPTSYEVVQIDSLTSTTLTLTENLDATWPAYSTVVLPARLGRLTQQMPATQHAHHVRTFKLIFEIDESSPSSNRITTLSPTQYRSNDTFEFPTIPTSTEASDEHEYALEHTYNIIDAQTGTVALDTGARSTPYILVPYAQKFRDRAQVSEWLGFLDRRQGRRVPFWMPSWDKDFQPTGIAATVNGWIDYTATGYPDLINMADGRKDIVIIVERDTISYDRGTHKYRRITATSDNGDGTERINMNMSDFSGGEYTKIRVSFARYCHLESDTAEIAWETSCIAQTKTVMRELFSVPS